jgi:hypothetical protein
MSKLTYYTYRVDPTEPTLHQRQYQSAGDALDKIFPVTKSLPGSSERAVSEAKEEADMLRKRVRCMRVHLYF